MAAVVIKAALFAEQGPALVNALVEHLDIYIFAIIAATEGYSILENVTGKGPRRVASYIHRVFRIWSEKKGLPTDKESDTHRT